MFELLLLRPDLAADLGEEVQLAYEEREHDDGGAGEVGADDRHLVVAELDAKQRPGEPDEGDGEGVEEDPARLMVLVGTLPGEAGEDEDEEDETGQVERRHDRQQRHDRDEVVGAEHDQARRGRRALEDT